MQTRNLLKDVAKMTINFTSIGVLIILFCLLTTVIMIWSEELPGFIARKLFHMGGGLICCLGAIICPTYIEGCIAALAATVAVVAMRLLSRLGFSDFLYSGSDEKSLGDILFPAAVLLMAWVTRIDRLSFILPVLIMSLADCSAAFVGKAIGTTNLAGYSEDKKSAEGSLAFFAVSFAASTLACAVWSNIGINKILLISFIIALCCTMAEMFSSRGTDNLIIPIIAYLLIKTLPAFSLVTIILFAALISLLFISSMISAAAMVTTFFCALRYCALLFVALVLYKAHYPNALLYIVVAAAAIMLVSSKPMTAPFGTVLFTLLCATLITGETLPGALIIVAGNAAIVAYGLSGERKRNERTDKYESAGNAVLSRG